MLVVGTNKEYDDIFNHEDTIHQRDRRTDRQTETDTGRQQRPRLRIASQLVKMMTSAVPFSLPELNAGACRCSDVLRSYGGDCAVSG